MQKNLKEFSDKVIESHSTTSKALAGIMAGAGVISIGGLCCKALIPTYGGFGSMAPILMEGEFSIAEEIGNIAAALSTNPASKW